MKLLVIFDLDGTLWDSRSQIVPIWNRVFSRYPEIKIRITEQDCLGYMGRTIWDIAEEILPHHTEEQRHIIMKECSIEETEYLRIHGAVLYPHLLETLKELQHVGYDLHIVSNCQDGYIEAFMEAHDMNEYFTDYECPGRTGLSKAKNIQLILERNPWSKAVYIGDTLGDYNAATEAGLPFIHAKYGFGSVPDAKFKLNSLLELPLLLSTLFANSGK